MEHNDLNRRYQKLSDTELRLLLSEVGEEIDRRRKVTGPGDVFSHVAKYGKKRTEHYFVVTLDASNSVIRVHTITKGLVNRTMIHPREVFQTAIKDGATAIIVGHNHPSGHTDPSPEDREIQRRIKKSGELLQIKVLDSLIVARNTYYSAAERGEL